ncbi:MAG: PucR family transcriptional regulator [Sporichthyaceae bacterium]
MADVEIPPVRIAVTLDDDEAALLRRLTGELLEHLDTISSVVAQHILEHNPAIAPADDPEARVALHAAVTAHNRAALTTLVLGVSPDHMGLPEGALENVNRAAQSADALPVLLRTYRLGEAALWQIWAAHLGRGAANRDQLDRLIRAASAHLAAYVDRLFVLLDELWLPAVQAAARGDRRRVAALRALLAGESVMLGELNHPLDRPQVVLAARAIAGIPEHAVKRLGDLVADRLGRPPRIEASFSDDRTLLWFAVRRPLPPEKLRSLLKLTPAQTWCAIAQAPPGALAFVAAATEASDALAALERTKPTGGATTYADIALLATLLADDDRARRFARSVLGPLAVETAHAERLRDTLRAYFEAGERKAAAAAVLGIHEKTVAQRLHRVEQELGEEITARRNELETALLVFGALSTAAPPPLRD